ncbi:FKBP-type peptidyl-prolyl cis-trans isomerase N-terminal domain-containing protein [Kosakonia cowanii]|jgi:FKBP-type peptidyl-prolyl cis-trans isomerase|uniref:FKBP-type peptidyl-prolyl cis-trans isomerase N-terminal domain-containing protein n=1 Tax=Kosakonia cowanii TaxID=208223 RepID=UPI00034D448C|nr:FKBP-type peptidyl-prolyl cis-trans isomerase N-terminal domain-containing protein [Kosakonia cowanii]MDT3413477.1 FKBP-type peptidyl-prolyl cis-trans isomerase FkpA [Atlantibacter sp. SORGH_AS_0304]
MRKLLYSSAVLLSAISSSGVRADPAALLEQLNKEKIIAVTPHSPFINDRLSAQTNATPAPPVEVQSKAKESEAKRAEVAQLKRKLALAQRQIAALKKKQRATAVVLPAKQDAVAKESASLKQQLQTYIQQLAETKQKLADESDALKHLRDEKSQLEQQLKASQQQLAQTSQKHADDTQALQAFRTANSDLQQQVKTHQQQLEALEKQGQQHTAAPLQNAEQVKQLTQAKEEISSKLNLATKQVSDQAARITTLEAQLKQRTEENAQAEQKSAAALAPQKAQSRYLLTENRSPAARMNYAWGAWFAAKAQQESVTLTHSGQKYLPEAFLQGFQDKFAGSLQMKSDDIEKVLQSLNKKMGDAQKNELAQNRKQAQNVLAEAAKLKGAERTANGIIYLVEKKGQGVALLSGDVIRFRVDEKLSSGKVLSRGAVHSGRISELPPLMRAGIEKVVVGGRIRIYTPAELAYGEQGIPGMVPPGVASIMTLEILGIVK